MSDIRDDATRAARREAITLGVGAPGVGVIVLWALLPHGAALAVTYGAIVTIVLLAALGVAYAAKRRSLGAGR